MKKTDRTELEKFAKESAGDYLTFPSYACRHFDDEVDPDNWTIYYFHTNGNNGSTCLSESNKAYMERELKPHFDSGDIFSITDWSELVGYMDGIAIHVYSESGEITEAFEAFARLVFRMEVYQPLDEDDWCNREYDLFQQLLCDEVKTFVNGSDDFDESDVDDLCCAFLEGRNTDYSEGCFPYEALTAFLVEQREERLHAKGKSTAVSFV